MMGLFSTVPGCTWLYPAVPGSALVYHDLPCHRLPLTGLNAFVYTGSNAQSGMDGTGLGWTSAIEQLWCMLTKHVREINMWGGGESDNCRCLWWQHLFAISTYHHIFCVHYWCIADKLLKSSWLSCSYVFGLYFTLLRGVREESPPTMFLRTT